MADDTSYSIFTVLTPEDAIMVQYLDGDKKVVLSASFNREQALDHIAKLTKLLAFLPGDKKQQH